MLSKIRQIISGKSSRPERTSSDDLTEMVVLRIADLFSRNELCCSESVLYVINQTFRGSLSPEQSVRLGSGFCHGMGGGDGVCGALSGAIMTLGLFLGRSRPGEPKQKKFDPAVKALHDQFVQKFGTTSCRTLCDAFGNNRRARKRNCALLTQTGGALATETLLDRRPDLIAEADIDFLKCGKISDRSSLGKQK